jgi:hypothetical protein
LRRDQQLDLNSDAFLDVVRRHRVVFVQGWFFRNRDNCARHRELICTHFTPWERHLARAHAAIESARRRGRFVIGVHMRRTDYTRYKGGQFYYSHDQYRSVMERVQAAFPDQGVSFLICSDEPVPRDTFAGLDVLYGSGHELEDLYALAACDRLIGPLSTYTTWASYYGHVPLYRIADPDKTPTADCFTVRRGL